MSAYCPKCETDLDPYTGICPACRWDPRLANDLRPISTVEQSSMSLTERYRGTRWDASLRSEVAGGHVNLSRGRTFVIVSLVAAAAIYGLVLSVMGPF